MFIDPNDFSGSDSERLNQAVARAAAEGVVVRIGKRKGEREYWLLDSAVLVPSNTVMILENCRWKLSNSCRDNFIRSANCVPGGEFVEQAENIHISGIGNVVLEGAENPRSTGDSGKRNKAYSTDYTSSYGTDGMIPDAMETWGDWRNIGILLVRVKNFSLEGVTVKDPHCWSISLEYCTDGLVRNIQFDSVGCLTEHSGKPFVRNQDGLDLRRGCKRIRIENIRGRTGDDVIALTAIAGRSRPAGQAKTTEFCGMQPEGEINDTCCISISNVQAYSAGGHHIVRFLNNGGVRIHHVQLEGLMDTAPADFHCKAAVKVGDTNYGGLAAAGDTYGFQISHIQSNAQHAILLAGPLTDSCISNIISFFHDGAVINRCAEEDGSYRGLAVNNITG